MMASLKGLARFATRKGTLLVAGAAVLALLGALAWNLPRLGNWLERQDREALLLDSLQRDEAAITTMEGVALWASRCRPDCGLASAKRALGTKYEVSRRADGRMDVRVPPGVGVIEVTFTNGQISRIRREPHVLGPSDPAPAP